MWTEVALHDLIASRMNNYQMIVVANREPYQHRFAGDSIECIRPASGMAAALDPVMRASGGTWVAHGSGDADRLTVDEHDHVQVPPENSNLYPAPGVVEQGTRGRLLPRTVQPGAMAALPRHFHSTQLRCQAVGGLLQGQRDLRRRRGAGGR